jgi:hypothetical protein
MTAIDLRAWISIYIGLGLIRAAFSCSRANSAHHDPRSKLAVPGYFLLVIGAFVLGADVLHHFR